MAYCCRSDDAEINALVSDSQGENPLIHEPYDYPNPAEIAMGLAQWLGNGHVDLVGGAGVEDQTSRVRQQRSAEAGHL